MLMISWKSSRSTVYVDGLTQYLNSVDDTGSIKFTAEQEQDEQMPFLDTLIVRKTCEAIGIQKEDTLTSTCISVLTIRYSIS